MALMSTQMHCVSAACGSPGLPYYELQNHIHSPGTSTLPQPHLHVSCSPLRCFLYMYMCLLIYMRLFLYGLMYMYIRVKTVIKSIILLYSILVIDCNYWLSFAVHHTCIHYTIHVYMYTYAIMRMYSVCLFAECIDIHVHGTVHLLYATVHMLYCFTNTCICTCVVHVVLSRYMYIYSCTMYI